MTSWIVFDSGIFLAIALDEPTRPLAFKLTQNAFASQSMFAAPMLFRYEVAATVRKHRARGTLKIEEENTALNYLLELPIDYRIDEALLRRSVSIAEALGLPTTYDAQYLAVAEDLGCDFWTADHKLVNQVGEKLTWVRWLGSYTPPVPAS